MKLVLIRGLARESGHWGEFVTLLKNKLSPYTQKESTDNQSQMDVFTPDCLGCGKFYKETATTSIAATTDHIRQQIFPSNGVAKPSPLILVGLSMGAMIAMDWAARYPDEIKGLVIINTSTGEQVFWWRVRLTALPKVLFALIAPTSLREVTMLKLVSNNTEQYPKNIKDWCEIQKNSPVTRSTIIRQLIAAARFRIKLYLDKQTEMDNQKKTPQGLVLVSNQDRLVSSRCSKALAKIMKWPIKVNDNAGHDLPLDDPEWVVNHIVTWFKNVTNL